MAEHFWGRVVWGEYSTGVPKISREQAAFQVALREAIAATYDPSVLRAARPLTKPQGMVINRVRGSVFIQSAIHWLIKRVRVQCEPMVGVLGWLFCPDKVVTQPTEV